MKRSSGGSIVNISSNSGIWGIPMAGAYSASKWAVRGLSKTGALEREARIRVNSVHPGGVDTPMVRAPGTSRTTPRGRRTCPSADSVAPKRSRRSWRSSHRTRRRTSRARSGRWTAAPRPAIAVSSTEPLAGEHQLHAGGGEEQQLAVLELGEGDDVAERRAEPDRILLGSSAGTARIQPPQ